MAKPKNAKSVVRYTDSDIVVLDHGPSKSPRFELWDEPNNKSLAKSDNPIDFDPIVYGEEWAERNDWYEIHGKSAPKKKRTRRTRKTD